MAFTYYGYYGPTTTTTGYGQGCWYDSWDTWTAYEEAIALSRRVQAVLAFLRLLGLFLARKLRRPHWPHPAPERAYRRPTLRGTRDPRAPPCDYIHTESPALPR